VYLAESWSEAGEEASSADVSFCRIKNVLREI
jgi:hypothetical protein